MKVLFFSDLHLQPFWERKFESQKRNWFEIAIIWMEIIPYWIRSALSVILNRELKVLSKADKICLSIKNIIEDEKISLCISNGDFSESLYTEQGMRTSEDLRIAVALRKRFKEEAGITRLEENAGNHEMGYNLPLCTDPMSGINKKGIQNFLKLTGRRENYHSFSVEGFKIILIPYFFSEDKAVDFDLPMEKKKFLWKFQQDMLVDIPIIIFIHDPDSFNDNNLLKIIRGNRNKIKFIFYGHYHSKVNLLGAKILIGIYNCRWLLPLRCVLNYLIRIFAKRDEKIVQEIGKYFRKRKNTPALIREIDARLIPSPTGMYDRGFGVLDLSDGSYRIIK